VLKKTQGNKVAITCLILYLLFLHKAFACSLTLAVSNDFPPYHMKNVDGHWSGLSVDLVRALVSKTDCDLKIINVPWIRSISLLRQGKIHLITNFTSNAERAQFSLFLGPHHVEKAAFIARMSLSNGIYNLSRLQYFNGVIAITRGNSFGEEFDRYVIDDVQLQSKLVQIKNNVDRYSLLIKGRIDGMFDDELSAQYILASTHKENELFDIQFTLKGNPVYFGVSPIAVSPELRAKLNQSWLALLEDNTVETLYQKYDLFFDKKEFNGFEQKLLNTKN